VETSRKTCQQVERIDGTFTLSKWPKDQQKQDQKKRQVQDEKLPQHDKPRGREHVKWPEHSRVVQENKPTEQKRKPGKTCDESP